MLPSLRIETKNLERTLVYLRGALDKFREAIASSALEEYFTQKLKPSIISFTPNLAEEGRIISSPGPYKPHATFEKVRPFLSLRRALEREGYKISSSEHRIVLNYGNLARVNKRIGFAWYAVWYEGDVKKKEFRTTGDKGVSRLHRASPLWESSLLQMWEFGGSFTVRPRGKPPLLYGEKESLTKTIPPQAMFRKALNVTRNDLVEKLRVTWIKVMNEEVKG